jgi:hypothetical protein
MYDGTGCSSVAIIDPFKSVAMNLSIPSRPFDVLVEATYEDNLT